MLRFAAAQFFAASLLLFVFPCFGQNAARESGVHSYPPPTSPHALHSIQRPQPRLHLSGSEENLQGKPPQAEPDRSLTHTVFGYHPYWIDDSVAAYYRFELLSHLAYFSAEVDAPTGELSTIRGWLTSPVVDRALAAGIEVQLAVTNFGSANNRSLLQSTAARDTLIARLIELVRLRGADGLAIDFEGVPGDQRENLTAFFAALRGRLRAAVPGATISAAVPAVDWSDAWDAEALAQYIDLVFVMCYDYSWSGSSAAGPVSPVQGMSYNVRRSLETWLQNGIPPERLLMGVPYYGYDWPVTSELPRAATTGRATARTYSYVSGMLQRYERQWNAEFQNPWFPYQVVDWRQVWYDDAESLDYKYRLVPELQLAGVGMWALGYDADLPDLWMEIEEHFTRTTGVEVEPPAVPGGLTVFPQPAESGRGLTMLLDELSRDGSVHIAIMDLLGRTTWSTHRDAGNAKLQIRLPALKAGTYVLRVETSGTQYFRPIVVLR